MYRKRLGILAVFLLIGTLTLVYGAQVFADLNTLAATSPTVFDTTLTLVPDGAITRSPEAELLAVRPIVAQRLDQLNLDGFYNVAVRHGQLELTLPKDANIPYIASVITSLGEIVFIDGGTESPPLDQQVQIELPAGLEHNAYPILFTSREVQQITPPDPTTGQIFYDLVLKPAAADRLANFVADQPGAYICMVMDGQVINCSTMYHQEDQTLEILPELSSGTAVSMTDLAVFLHSGPLPTRLKVITN